MTDDNTSTSKELALGNPTLNDNNTNDTNTNSEEKSNEKQRAEWTYDRDLIYMKGLVECYPPAQGHGNVTKAWKDLQAAVNSIDQHQGQLKTTTLKCRGSVLIEEYKERKKRQQQSTGSGGNHTTLDQWISKYMTMLQSIAEKKGKGKGKAKEDPGKLSQEAESSTAKRPASDDDDGDGDDDEDSAKRTKVLPDMSPDESLNVKILQQLTRHTEAMEGVQASMTAMTNTLENGFQSLNATLNRLANAMAKPAPSPRRPIVPAPIQKKTDNNKK